MKNLIQQFKIMVSILLIFPMAHAQMPAMGSAQNMGSGSEYFAGRIEGKPLIKVNLVGGVRLPGVYHVPIDTNLAEVLSYAGGTVDGAELDEIHVRSMLGAKSTFRTYDFQNLSKNTAENYPTIKNDDIIQINVSKDGLARTALWVAIIGSIVSVTLATLTYQHSR